ncbi:uncharacterized protein C8R40DRAFT_1068264 [Lentinula edodes]|uniref:uncharacterized protein n=1 Tax=Lentinula edodes TaxID=5353 RepID=UPI001E8D8DEF|nr:uncharacterized protein C8R40DRAFT_1068264 [Lentinula edodes]KAH7877052.1 hypothetical protein C8R40DRAFT_1068264 [Lentinula edodes]
MPSTKRSTPVVKLSKSSKKPRRSSNINSIPSSSLKINNNAGSSSSSSDSSSDSGSDSTSDSDSSDGGNNNNIAQDDTLKEKGRKEKTRVKIIHIPKHRIDPMDKAGRWAVCAVDAFLNISAIETTKLESLEEGYEPAESDQPFLQAWDQLVLIAPILETLLMKAHTEKGQMKYVDALDKISRSALCARQYHTGIIRRDILDWIIFKDDETYLPKYPKSLRGINHPATLRLIIPQCFRNKVDDPTFIEKVENGRVRIEASEWPAFLYDQDLADVNDIEKGLFTGGTLFSVFFAIFFGISSAQTGTYQKNSIAARNGMKKVTGRNIAYAAIQARFALSSVEKWNIPDNHFDYVVFYNEIVDFFEDYPKDEHVVSILADWNEYVTVYLHILL